MKLLATAAVLLCAPLAAADVSGTWTGTIDVADPSDGHIISTPVRLALVQKDGALSGTIGRAQDAKGEPLSNGRTDGQMVTFEVASAEAAGVMKFRLELKGATLAGEMAGKLEGTGEIKGKVALTRGK